LLPHGKEDELLLKRQSLFLSKNCTDFCFCRSIIFKLVSVAKNKTLNRLKNNIGELPERGEHMYDDEDFDNDEGW
jgi:hypothetical protein